MKNIEDYKDYIIDQYVNRQKTALDISRDIDFHNSTISRALHRWGVSRGRLSEKRINITEDVVKDYVENGLYCEEIAKKYQVEVHTVYGILNEKQVQRKNGCKSKCNEDYFEKIDNPNKAYLLGFITADGAIVNNKLSIEVKNTDIGLIKFTQQQINPDAAITHCKYQSKPQVAANGKIYQYEKDNYRIAFGSQKIGQDLAKYGIVQNKSKTISRVPVEYISKDLLPFYFRGLVDGDGCIHKDGKVSIYSGSKAFIENVQQILVEEVGVKKLKIYHGTSYFVSWGSKEDKNKLFHYLYSNLDSTYYYFRKYERLLTAIANQANTEVTS